MNVPGFTQELPALEAGTQTDAPRLVGNVITVAAGEPYNMWDATTLNYIGYIRHNEPFLFGQRAYYLLPTQDNRIDPGFFPKKAPNTAEQVLDYGFISQSERPLHGDLAYD
jgi:hypothetical protein